jgi:hypothetical protein
MVMLRSRRLVSWGVEAVPVVQEVLLDRHMVCCASHAHIYGTLGWVGVCVGYRLGRGDLFHYLVCDIYRSKLQDRFKVIHMSK